MSNAGNAASSLFSRSINSFDNAASVNNSQVSNPLLNCITPVLLNIDAAQLQIIIQQTRVKEDQNNKPFTEYVIEFQYQDTKWVVGKKFKNFCDLHQSIASTFPGIKFPESSKAIISSSSGDAIGAVNTKRPTVIEERRKALQLFLRDLAKMDLVRNSKAFKNFTEFDTHIERALQISSAQTQNQAALESAGQPDSAPRSDIKNLMSQFIQNSSTNPLNQSKQLQQQTPLDKKQSNGFIAAPEEA